jgi:hypothetical protein
MKFLLRPATRTKRGAPDPDNKVEAALLELRVLVLFRLAGVLGMETAVSGHLSDQDVLDHLSRRQNDFPSEAKRSHWWSGALSSLWGR